MEGISLGLLFLRWNGLLVALGVACGALFFAVELRRRMLDPEIVYYLFMPLLTWGLIGARLWHVFTPPLSSVQLGLTTTNYLTHPLDILAFGVGGLGIPGAWLGGIIVFTLFARKYELSFGELTDAVAPGLAVAHVVGRVGNYFNQELYGLPTDLPWKIFIQPASRLIGYEQVEYYHPLFAYEALMSVVMLLALLWVGRVFARQQKTGDIFLYYVLMYSVVRFLLEFLRLDVALIGGVNVNQVFFGLTFVGAAGILLWRHRFAREL